MISKKYLAALLAIALFSLSFVSCMGSPIDIGIHEFRRPCEGEATLTVENSTFSFYFSLSEADESENRYIFIKFLEDDVLGGLSLTYENGNIKAELSGLRLDTTGEAGLSRLLNMFLPTDGAEPSLDTDGRLRFTENSGRIAVFSAEGIPQEIIFEDLHVKIIWFEYKN